MTTGPRLALRSFILLSVTVLVTTEAVLRLAFGFGHPLLYSADQATGYLPTPNQELRRFGVRLQINELGMRSGHLEQPKSPLTTRLLFIGDSVTFGTTYVDQSQIFTQLIQSSLAVRHRSAVDVQNASAGGWAPENEWQYLASRGTLEADTIVFVLNTNDLSQPFARLEDSRQFPTHNPITALGEVLERYVAPRLISGFKTADPGSLSDSEPEPQIEERVLQVLELARAFADAHQARFWLIFSPTDAASMRTPAWLTAIDGLKQWAARAHVPLIDMSATYSKYARDQVYFDGLHLRPFGHQLVAEEFLTHFRSALAAP